MFNKTKKVLLFVSICLCIMATFIASNRTAPTLSPTDKITISRKAAYASFVLNIDGKYFEFGFKVSTKN